ncbi:MAG TPA: FAD-dependent oxidoreductase [Acetobacteraceae bacterium]|jgi:D-amino-acid dehydrogenase|nr:FAD-dependent oxidoreductase [Acetobacteraceae bacterium]
MRAIVVGAGVLGASAAYHLARAGAQVIVIDAARDGRATAAGAGLICPWVSGVDDAVFYALYADGGRYYTDLVPALAELGETDLGFRRSGALVVSADAAELACIERFARQRQADAPEMGAISRLAPREARALFPPLRQEYGAVHVAGGARVDGRRLAAALLRAAQKHGATLHPGEATLRADGNRVLGVIVAGETITADEVIVTAGVWAPELLHRLGIPLPIAPQRGQIIHLRVAGYDTRDWPVILPPGSHYLVTFDDARVVAGATREPGAGFAYRVTAAGQAEVLAHALDVAPGLAGAELIETRVGFRPVGPEVRPLLGRVRGVDGLVIGNGLGAAGLTIGPLAGRLLAEVALGQQTRVDLVPFDPLRRSGSQRPHDVALR